MYKDQVKRISKLTTENCEGILNSIFDGRKIEYVNDHLKVMRPNTNQYGRYKYFQIGKCWYHKKENVISINWSVDISSKFLPGQYQVSVKNLSKGKRKIIEYTYWFLRRMTFEHYGHIPIEVIRTIIN